MTGLLHSGTSAVAGMLHAMGVRMVETGTTAPVPGGYHEFEDPGFTHWAAAGGRNEDYFNKWYWDRREAHAAWATTYQVHDQWGVKTPFLLRCWQRFEELVGRCGDEVRWVLTDRVPEQCTSQAAIWARSYIENAQVRQATIDMHANINRELRENLMPDGLVVNFENMIRTPTYVARQLCERFGIHLDMSARAARTITPP